MKYACYIGASGLSLGSCIFVASKSEQWMMAGGCLMIASVLTMFIAAFSGLAIIFIKAFTKKPGN